MNLKRGFKRITFVLSIVAAITCAGLAMALTLHISTTAQGTLIREQRRYEDEYNTYGTEITQEQAKAELRRREALSVGDQANEERRRTRWAEEKAFAKARLDELANGFWVRLSKVSLVGLCIAAGLAGALAGFSLTWLVVWFGGLTIYKFIKWLILGFCDDVNSKRVEVIKG
jgi:hypothetical protein